MRTPIKSLACGLALALAACSVTTPPEPAKPAAPAAKLMAWPDLLTRQRPEPSASISYGTESMQRVDLWTPEGKGPHPTVLMVHGGCWQTEIADRRIMDWISDDLRRRGIAVWNIDYRGVDKQGGGYPGTFLDAAAAADALRTNATKYNLDISPLVAVGHSAGGHLALWLAARPAANVRATSVVVTAGTLQQPEETEKLLTRPVERIVRSQPGVSKIMSSVEASQSRTVGIFSSPQAAQAASDRIAAELAAKGLRNVRVQSPVPLPAGSPVAAIQPVHIDTVVSLGGLPDLEEAARAPGSGCGTEVVGKLTGGRFADTSVPRLLPLGVPQVLINGLQDRIIPTAYAEGYAAPARAAGDTVKVRMIDNTGHVELIAPETAAWAAAVEEIQAGLGIRRK